MSDLIGFESLLRTLSEHLPSVVLFTGPAGIGKKKLCRELAARHTKIKPLVYKDGMTAGEARELRMLIGRKTPGLWPVLINLDGVSEQTGNILLKTLEEPPAKVRFLLWASEPVLPTILSRAMVYPCAPLSTDEVRRVLSDVLGWAPVRAEIASKVSGGSVGTALARMEKEPKRQVVINFLRCVGERETDRIPGYMSQFDSDHMQILGIWAAESMTGVWSWFTPGDVPGMRGSPATLAVLSSPTRPRLKAWAVTKTLTGA